MWNLFFPFALFGLSRGMTIFPKSGLCIDGESGNPITCPAESGSTTEEWNCDIRAWTRAPDLIPGHATPAETRLSLIGPRCADISGWEVGLRMKERAIVKIRNTDHVFPEKPKRKPFNMTESRLNRPDRNDIFTGRSGYGILHRDDEEYEIQLNAYNDAIRNKSLFKVDGQERMIFESKLDFDIPATQGEESVNHIRAFSVKVPFTNFPPMKAHEQVMGSSGKDEQMLNTETMLEYFHLLHLSNGTILDIPAGRAGFLTEPYPVTRCNEHLVQETAWPSTVVLRSPRPLEKTESNDESLEPGFARHRLNNGPDCDAGNRAEFELTISSDVKSITPDRNITLSVHMKRMGNGSEYPAFIDFSLSTFENITFAYEHDTISSVDQYQNLLQGDEHYSYGTIDSSFPQKMLMVKSQESLEWSRRDSESSGSSYTSFGGRWPVQRGTVRYDFEEEYETVCDNEEHDFKIELPISYDAFPNFEKVFGTLTPSITFQLHTTFICARPQVSIENETEDQIFDDQWAEWRLPSRGRSHGGLGSSMSLQHRGSLPIHIHRHTNLTPEQQQRLKHYLDPEARAPALSISTIQKITPLQEDDLVVLALVGQERRAESEIELKRSRYDLSRSGRQHQPRCHPGLNIGGCWNNNNGGGGMHAASLWQRMEEETKNGVSEDQLRQEQVVYQMAGSML